jgi:uncharacterized protein (TIGR03083 family)
MADSQIWAHIDEQRDDLADFLHTLTPRQWETPSLCPGWTVRQAAAHITHSTTNWGTLTLELLRTGMRFNALTLRMGLEDQRKFEEITAALRGMVGVRRRPPGTAAADPLADVLVHGQDIAVPSVSRGRCPFQPRSSPPNGAVVRGPILDIVMTLSGRRAGLAVE